MFAQKGERTNINKTRVPIAVEKPRKPGENKVVRSVKVGGICMVAKRRENLFLNADFRKNMWILLDKKKNLLR